MAETRGSWTIDEGIAARWDASGLDATFRAEWDDSQADYQPLNDEEARPQTPTPYCVYEKALQISWNTTQGLPAAENISKFRKFQYNSRFMHKVRRLSQAS